MIPDGEPTPPVLPWWRRVIDWIAGAEGGPAVLPPGALVRPFGVAANAQGEVFVADPDLARVTRYDRAARPTLIECREARWSAPIAVALAPDGTLFVADAASATIVRWAPGGCTLLGSGSFERPTGLAVTADRIWVVDPPRHQVIALSHSGAELGRFGGLGEGNDGFHFPTAVALAPDGTILVVDALNYRVVRLAADGRWLGSFGATGDAGGASPARRR